MSKKFGIKVLVKESNQYGFIVRRFNSQAYEIELDDNKVVVLDPKEFIEIERDKDEN